MPEPIRILIADDHAVVHEGLRSMLSTQADFELAGSAFDGEQAIRLAEDLQPDVILLDLVMPRVDGLEAVRQIWQMNMQIQILLLTSFVDDIRVFQAIKAGAVGYMLKDTPREHLFQAIRDLARGRLPLQPAIAFHIMQDVQRTPPLPLTKNPLTPLEGETLRLIVQGFNHADIAARMKIDVQSVIDAIRMILDKLHLANHTRSALYVQEDGLPR